MPLRWDGTEKGIDVWLAFEAAVNGRIDVCVPVAGAGGYVPLVRKLVALNTRGLVLGRDLPPADEWGGAGTSQSLLEAATYPVRTERIIEAGGEVDGEDTLLLGEHTDRGGPLKSGPPPPTVQASELSRDAEPGWETDRVKFVRDGEGGRRCGFVTPDAGGPGVWFGDDLLVVRGRPARRRSHGRALRRRTGRVCSGRVLGGRSPAAGPDRRGGGWGGRGGRGSARPWHAPAQDRRHPAPPSRTRYRERV